MINPREARLEERALDEANKRWEGFLRNLALASAGLSRQTAQHVRTLWHALEGAGGEVPPPFAAATEAGGLSMTWDHGRHHFELEVLSDGTYDWFYMDRNSVERAGEEATPLGTYTAEMFSYLRRASGTRWRS